MRVKAKRTVELLPHPEVLESYNYVVDGSAKMILNMFEMEQWGTPPRPFPIWIAHVAFVSPNIQRLTNFYSTTILQLDAPPEIRRINGIPNLDVVGNADNVDLYGTWVPATNILIEIWQYINPKTPDKPSPSSLNRLGYTHICFEVDDVVAEYQRLSHLDVPFVSDPVQTPNSVIVFGRDPDGNIFELLQYLTPTSSSFEAGICSYKYFSNSLTSKPTPNLIHNYLVTDLK